MRKQLLRVLVVLILVAGLAFYLKRAEIYSRLVVPDIVEWESPSQRTLPLGDGMTVRQYFIPHFNGLFRVGFPCDYREALDSKLEVTLKEADTEREVFKEVIPLRRFPKNKMRRFSFPPLWDSADKLYYLNIAVSQTSPEAELRLWYGSWPFFHIRTRGGLYLGEKELPGELSLVTECRVRARKSEFYSYWSNFLNDKIFAAFYIGTVVIGLGWLSIRTK